MVTLGLGSKPYDAETCFPWTFAQELFETLRAKGARFEVFKEVALPDGRRPISFEEMRQEYSLQIPGANRLGSGMRAKLVGKLWRRLGVRAGLARLVNPWISRPLTVYLQHDADRQAYKTVEMMRLQQRMGLRSSNFFFYERNICDEDLEPYVLDVESLLALEAEGFEIGYHLNAFELAGYNVPEAERIIDRDISWFRSHFNVGSFVPHGGQWGPDRQNNDTFGHPDALADLMWAYNGGGLHSDATWSDGHIEFETVLDPRILARRAPRGARIHFLMHPQYYGNELSPVWLERPIAREQWWRDLWKLP